MIIFDLFEDNNEKPQGVTEGTLNELTGYGSNKAYQSVEAYKRYDVYVSRKKFNNIAFIAVAENPRTRDISFKAQGNTPQEAVDNLKAEIDREIDSATKVSGQAILDFNVDFVKAILELSADTFYAKIVPGPRLVIAGSEMLQYPDIMRSEGFKPSSIRTSGSSEGTTPLPGVPLSSKAAVAANLIANGRYVLGDETVDRDGNRVFDLNFDSVVQASNDKMRLRVPAVTVGTNRSPGVTEAEGPGRVDPILYKALARMTKGGYDDAKIALAIEFGLLDMKHDYAIANNYIPKLVDLYNQKHGVAEGKLNEERELRIKKIQELSEGLSMDDFAKIPMFVVNNLKKAAFATKHEAIETKDAVKTIYNWSTATPDQKTAAKKQMVDIAKIAAGLAIAGTVGHAGAAVLGVGQAATSLGAVAQTTIEHIITDLGIEAIAEILATSAGINIVKNTLHDITGTSSGHEYEKKQYQQGVKQRIQTKPMAGPIGPLPESLEDHERYQYIVTLKSGKRIRFLCSADCDVKTYIERKYNEPVVDIKDQGIVGEPPVELLPGEMKEVRKNTNEVSPEYIERYKKEHGRRATAADQAGDYAKGHEHFKKINKLTKQQFQRDAKPEKVDEISNFMTQPAKPVSPEEQWKRQIRLLAKQYQANASSLAALARENGPDSAEAVAYEYLRDPSKIRVPGTTAPSSAVNWDEVIRRLPMGLSGMALLQAAEEYLINNRGMLRSTVRSLLNNDENQRTLSAAYAKKNIPSESVTEESDNEAVEQAIVRRIMVGRTDLLLKYGPKKVMQAVEEVADYVGSVDEIGSSDVSGWIRQVERVLG